MTPRRRAWPRWLNTLGSTGQMGLGHFRLQKCRDPAVPSMSRKVLPPGGTLRLTWGMTCVSKFGMAPRQRASPCELRLRGSPELMRKDRTGAVTPPQALLL